MGIKQFHGAARSIDLFKMRRAARPHFCCSRAVPISKFHPEEVKELVRLVKEV